MSSQQPTAACAQSSCQSTSSASTDTDIESIIQNTPIRIDIKTQHAPTCPSHAATAATDDLTSHLATYSLEETASLFPTISDTFDQQCPNCQEPTSSLRFSQPYTDLTDSYAEITETRTLTPSPLVIRNPGYYLYDESTHKLFGPIEFPPHVRFHAQSFSKLNAWQKKEIDYQANEEIRRLIKTRKIAPDASIRKTFLSSQGAMNGRTIIIPSKTATFKRTYHVSTHDQGIDTFKSPEIDSLYRAYSWIPAIMEEKIDQTSAPFQAKRSQFPVQPH